MDGVEDSRTIGEAIKNIPNIPVDQAVEAIKQGMLVFMGVLVVWLVVVGIGLWWFLRKP